MKRLIKLFVLQTVVVAVVAIPVCFYLRSDYREFQVKKQIALQVPAGIGAVCGDGWYSGSTGRGTCSHHGGVKYWGTELRQIAQTNWLSSSYLFFFILGAGLIGWYAFGARSIRRDHSAAAERSASNQLQRQCCTDSAAQGLRVCFECGATLGVNETDGRQPAVSPGTTYVLMIATTFLTIALGVVGIVYLRTRQNVEVAAVIPVVASSPSPSPSSVVSPTPAVTPTPKPTPTIKPEDDLDAGLVEPADPLEEAVRSAKEKATPTPDPDFVPSRDRTVNPPTPRPTIHTESLVYASDVLSPGYSRSDDRRVYRFHLSQQARVKGSFSARGNISVYITGGYYSSNGAISSDSIDVTLSAGTYEVVVSARETVGFSLHLTAYYDL
jgi:hypothetical protein